MIHLPDVHMLIHAHRAYNYCAKVWGQSMIKFAATLLHVHDMTKGQ